MLASLLAKQPSSTPIIPPIPASVISATPQDKLPRVTKNDFGMIGQQNTPTAQANTASDTNRQGGGRGIRSMTNRPLQTSYLNQMLTPGVDIQTAQHIR